MYKTPPPPTPSKSMKQPIKFSPSTWLQGTQASRCRQSLMISWQNTTSHPQTNQRISHNSILLLYSAISTLQFIQVHVEPPYNSRLRWRRSNPRSRSHHDEQIDNRKSKIENWENDESYPVPITPKPPRQIYLSYLLYQRKFYRDTFLASIHFRFFLMTLYGASTDIATTKYNVRASTNPTIPSLKRSTDAPRQSKRHSFL